MNISIPNDAARVTETPNAVMTTLASPTLGGTRELSLWKVRMRPDQCGPVHVFDAEQVWHVLQGSAAIEIDGTIHRLTEGDTLRIPDMATRQVRAESAVEFLVCGSGYSSVVSGAPGGESMTPAWIA